MYGHLLQVAGDHCRSTNISRRLQEINRRLANISRRLQEINRRLANISRRLQEINRRLANISRKLQGITVGWRTSPANCRRSPSVGEYLPQIAGDQPSVGEHLPQIAGDHRRLANISRRLQEINRRLANISRELLGITVGWRTSPADCRSLLCPPAIRPYEKGEERDASLFRPDSCAVSF